MGLGRSGGFVQCVGTALTLLRAWDATGTGFPVHGKREPVEMREFIHDDEMYSLFSSIGKPGRLQWSGLRSWCASCAKLCKVVKGNAWGKASVLLDGVSNLC